MNVNWEESLAYKIQKICAKQHAKSGVSELRVKRDDQNVVARTYTEKAEVLAECVTSAFTAKDKDDNDDAFIENIPYVEESNNENNFKTKEISKLLKNLNTSKSIGPVKVHPKVLLELADIIDAPLCMIFNSPFKAGNIYRRRRRLVSTKITSWKERRYKMSTYDGSEITLETVQSEKDVRVRIDFKLRLDKHIQARINKGNQLVGNTRRTFNINSLYAPTNSWPHKKNNVIEKLLLTSKLVALFIKISLKS
ncbi:unnamed protein product [Mytilus coruscus]|uniref:Uncharacterized protein n=1 Tax=Mytilus coruscus TaxID=42192 RepID=A0A6J8B3B2_MYTCO|nr:unnamed protein product [Mytilus coruscus]